MKEPVFAPKSNQKSLVKPSTVLTSQNSVYDTLGLEEFLKQAPTPNIYMNEQEFPANLQQEVNPGAFNVLKYTDQA